MYFKCNKCKKNFHKEKARTKTIPSNLNFFGVLYFCPHCGSSNLDKLTKKEYEEFIEKEKEVRLNILKQLKELNMK